MPLKENCVNSMVGHLLQQDGEGCCASITQPFFDPMDGPMVNVQIKDSDHFFVVKQMRVNKMHSFFQKIGLNGDDSVIAFHFSPYSGKLSMQNMDMMVAT
jgi:hypothetical protein